MAMIDLAKVMEEIKPLVIDVGDMQKATLGKSGLEINSKSTSIDLVTEVDKRSERVIIDFITKNYPEHDILAEESGLTGGAAPYRWVIDPLDGTTNYAQGLPIFSVSVALEYKNETVLGIVYTPVVGQLFTAIRGRGAYLNGEKIQVSAKTDLIQSVLATGFPYDKAAHAVNNLVYFNALIVKTRAVRRFGSAAYDFACTAAGTFDGYWEMNLSPWDVAAGILLVEEAGGKVVHFRQDRKISIIAGNPVLCQKIHDEIVQVGI
jgi:myo-inositol-1(or 4)-monophosphatase